MFDPIKQTGSAPYSTLNVDPSEISAEPPPVAPFTNMDEITYPFLNFNGATVEV